jgi:hypothetical protein
MVGGLRTTIIMGVFIFPLKMGVILSRIIRINLFKQQERSKTMNELELEELEKKVADTKAAHTVAPNAYKHAAFVAYLKAMDELKEYKEQAND